VTIDADVAKVAKQFGVDPTLIQAVVNAEGNILKAVQCSIPSITTREQAIEVTCRSAAHALSAYVSANDAEGFVAFWAAKWAPIGAQNDPKDLNRNWPLNVLRLWKRSN
jgi:hypothetical protein